MLQKVQIEPRPNQHYFIMLAEPNRELTAQANLYLRRIPFYLPTIFRAGRLPARRVHSQAFTRPDVAMPLFPRMIFIAEDTVACMMDAIRSTPGMMSNPFLRFGGQFAVLRPIGMDAIRTIEQDEREKYFNKKRRAGMPAWMPDVGDEVRILLETVLGGQSGRVADIDSKGRITLLTEIMKRTVRVQVTANQIEPV